MVDLKIFLTIKINEITKWKFHKYQEQKWIVHYIIPDK
jgi:hypothetical protein